MRMSKATQLVRLAALISGAGVVLGAGTASAAIPVTTCSDTCNSNCELASDLNCTNQTGITLNGGSDLDMKGHSLTCTTNCPPAAITMSANGSIVKNSFGVFQIESTISGAFPTAIECNGKTNAEVTGIHIVSSASGSTSAIGLHNCAKADGNVLVSSGHSTQGVAVSSGGVATSDFTSDNYIDGWGTAFYLSGAKAFAIQRNQIVIRETNGNEYGVFIPSGTTASMTFQGNSFYDSATAASYFVDQTSGTTAFHQNYCDPTRVACGSCYQCAQPVAPFPYP